MKRITVLVVDDSPTMRQLVARTLAADPELDVLATAGSAIEARDLIKQLSPDVMTLDVEMPEMDGLAFLERVMRLRPMPVVMVSTLTARGTDTAIEALAIGAVDCVAKPTAEDPHSFRDLAAKVKTASVARRAATPARAVQGDVRPMAEPGAAVVAIGSSTGGVEALIAVISRFPSNCAPTVITQHMPPAFTRSLAERLDRMSAPKVMEATHGAPLRPGLVYLAPGGDRHLEIAGTAALTCALRPGELVNGHCPSVDRLFASVARSAGAAAVGVILTGMGRDGAAGLAQMRRAGARTIGQDESTSVVYGMPKAAHEIGAVEIQLPLERIGGAIVEATAMRHQAE